MKEVTFISTPLSNVQIWAGAVSVLPWSPPQGAPSSPSGYNRIRSTERLVPELALIRRLTEPAIERCSCLIFETHGSNDEADERRIPVQRPVDGARDSSLSF